MHKRDLVRRVADQAQSSQIEAKKVIDAATIAITGCLSRGEKVSLPGFGTFLLMYQKARKGRNPQTGEEVHIPPQVVVRFVPAKKLKEKVT